MATDYESLTRINKFKRLVKVALVTVLICLVVVAPALWYCDVSIEMRAALRSAKNVLINTEMLAIKYDGLGETFLDSSRPSGLSSEAEDEIRLYSGAEGAITLTGWNSAKGHVINMTYQEKKFLLNYEWDQQAEGGKWYIYRQVRMYEN